MCFQNSTSDDHPSNGIRLSKEDPLQQHQDTPKAYMACSLMYRGRVSPGDVTSAIQKVISRRAARFVSWTPTGFKVCLRGKGSGVVAGQ